VICLDNFFTGDKANIAHHIGKYNFELIRHDVVDPILLEVDQVYHLACPASPVHYKFNPVRVQFRLPACLPRTAPRPAPNTRTCAEPCSIKSSAVQGLFGNPR